MTPTKRIIKNITIRLYETEADQIIADYLDKQEKGEGTDELKRIIRLGLNHTREIGSNESTEIDEAFRRSLQIWLPILQELIDVALKWANFSSNGGPVNSNTDKHKMKG